MDLLWRLVQRDVAPRTLRAARVRVRHRHSGNDRARAGRLHLHSDTATVTGALHVDMRHRRHRVSTRRRLDVRTVDGREQLRV